MYCGAPVVLTLAIPNGPTLDLMSEQQGLRVASVDLGYPPPREDMTQNPDRHGSYDLTKLYDVRPVVITGSIVPSPAGSRSASWRLLAPFLNPAARPVMTYQVDGDQIPKTMTVRASQMTALADNPTTSVFQVGFKAADPLAYDARVQTVYCFPFPPTGIGVGGRQYNLVYAPATPGPEVDRTYPAGGASSWVYTQNKGDQRVFPLLRIYGPLTQVQVQTSNQPAGTNQVIVFQPGYLIPAGHYVQCDCKAKTAYLDGDPSQSVYNQITWQPAASSWPYMDPVGNQPINNAYTAFYVSGSGAASSSQMQVTWQDGYLL